MDRMIIVTCDICCEEMDSKDISKASLHVCENCRTRITSTKLTENLKWPGKVTGSIFAIEVLKYINSTYEI